MSSDLYEYYYHSELPVDVLAKLQPFIHARRPHDEIPDCRKLEMQRVDETPSTWEFIKAQHTGQETRSWQALTCDINPMPTIKEEQRQVKTDEDGPRQSKTVKDKQRKTKTDKGEQRRAKDVEETKSKSTVERTVEKVRNLFNKWF